MALDQLPCFSSYSPEGVEGVFSGVRGQIAKAFSLHSMLEWLAVERARTCLREAGWKGDNKDEFEPVRAARRILRCSQRGQPPARRDVRWPWPSTGEQGGAGYGGVGPLLRKGAAPRLIPAEHDLARRCR